ncbi:hypothetical protein R5R35_010776 [Gryllus longicercus]|uniref:Cytochrome P450 n=1 Tax=Gryllus longicercus TaxID=2509291 RepID=A0AAN9VS08_9ORTH
MWQAVLTAVTNATLVDWALLLSGLLLLVYIAGTWNYDYFRKQGIASTQPKWPFLGDNSSAFLGLQSFQDLIRDSYNDGDGHAVYGMFEFTKPTFMIRDPELLKIVAVKEFDFFMNHRTIQSEKADPVFGRNLINLKDQPWRDMRATLSPAFTTSKMKAMFPLISDCADRMAQHLRQEYLKSPEGAQQKPLPTDMKNLFSRMATDVIATAAFGVSCDSLKQPDNEFYEMGKALTTFNAKGILKFLGFMLVPKLMEVLKMRVLDAKATEFFDTLVHSTIKERQQKGIFRPDMLQLLMQAREGQLKAEKEDAEEAEEVGAKKTILSDEDLSAQAVIFFFAGFETVSIAICLTAHLLSHHEDVQNRLYAEVAEMMEETGGKPTYESLQGMKYLDAVLNETLRLYPPAVGTDRVCQEDVLLPAGARSGPTLVRKGTPISIPITGLHYDPEFWTDPEKFDPERFSDENKHNIKPFTYMPFGVGPRVCIGQRFALVEVKLALVHLLANFELHPCSKTKHPLEFEPSFNLSVKGGFWCGIKPRET